MSILIRLLPLAVVICLFDTFFTVQQVEQAIVLQFGEYKDVYTEPGLKMKIPFIQDVSYYDKRVLNYDLPPIKITTGDQKRLVVDTYTRYQIQDPLKFFKAVKPASEVGAKLRLEAIVSSAVRNVVGRYSLFDILNQHRDEVRGSIIEEVRQQAEKMGLSIVDIRIIRTELPEENRSAVFSRMNAELSRFAKQNRAQGEEQAETIRAKAEKERTVILAQAKKTADILRGKADQKAYDVIANVIQIDPAFYSFYKLMQTYRKNIDDRTNLILSTDSSLLNYLTQALEKNLG